MEEENDIKGVGKWARVITRESKGVREEERERSERGRLKEGKGGGRLIGGEVEMEGKEVEKLKGG